MKGCVGRILNDVEDEKLNQEEFEEFIKEHPEAIKVMHWVRGSKRQRGYWRVKPYTYKDPTVNQLKTWIALAEVAYRNYGLKGLRVRNNKLMPPIQAKVYDALKGKKFKKPTFEETMRKVKRALKIIAEQHEKRRKKAVVT